MKADVGIKDGKIVAIGKAGNPYIQDNVNIIIGAGTEIIAGEGRILTAGGIDTHIHFICPQQIEDSIRYVGSKQAIRANERERTQLGKLRKSARYSKD